MNSKYFKVFVFALLIFSGCVSEELDNIQAFRYKFPDLETVSPLPTVELTIPAEVEVIIGGILTGKFTDDLVKDVVEAVIDEDIDEVNLQVIDRFSKISPEVSTDELRQVVTNDWIEGVISGAIQPSSDLIKIAQIFKSDPDLVKYLSQLEYPKIDGFSIGGRIGVIDNFFKDFPDRELLRMSSLVTPCRDAAELLYLENVEELERQAVLQIAQAKDFYDDLRNQAELNYNARLDEKDKVIEENLKKLNDFVVFFNSAVDQLKYPEDVIRGLKIFIIAYVVQVREQLVAFGEAYLLAAIFERDKRIALINSEQTLAEFNIREGLKKAIDDQTKLYNDALNNCHNQGAGG